MQMISFNWLNMLAMTILTHWSVQSQTPMIANGQVQLVQAQEAIFHDFVVPKSDSFNLLILEAEGGDGGWIEYTYIDRFNTPRMQRVSAGEGATVSANYRIGTGFNEIPPGTILRVIAGNRGQWAKYDLLPNGDYGAGGGGGTAILMSRDNGNKWELLLVAGGGGGAGVHKNENEIKYYPGLPGTSNENGVGGGQLREMAEGGSRGDGGQSNQQTGGGGGAFTDGQHQNGILNYGNAGWKDHSLSKQPLGGLGGIQDDLHNGGWGFGGGGSGAIGGGGGGGYSGGGAGMPGFGGGGGGSFINTNTAHPLNSSKQQNSDTNNPGDGYVRYLFTKQ